MSYKSGFVAVIGQRDVASNRAIQTSLKMKTSPLVYSNAVEYFSTRAKSFGQRDVLKSNS